MTTKIVPVSAQGDLSTPIVTETKPKTQAQKMWDEIANVKLDMFSLDNQFVKNYYKPLFVEPTRLYLVGVGKATAALPALETSLAAKYTIEQAEKYLIITPVVK